MVALVPDRDEGRVPSTGGVPDAVALLTAHLRRVGQADASSTRLLVARQLARVVTHDPAEAAFLGEKLVEHVTCQRLAAAQALDVAGMGGLRPLPPTVDAVADLDAEQASRLLWLVLDELVVSPVSVERGLAAYEDLRQVLADAEDPGDTDDPVRAVRTAMHRDAAFDARDHHDAWNARAKIWLRCAGVLRSLSGRDDAGSPVRFALHLAAQRLAASDVPEHPERLPSPSCGVGRVGGSSPSRTGVTRPTPGS